MTCRELADLLCDYLEGELEAERCAVIRSHLQACPECGCLVETYQLTIQISRRLPPSPVPEHLLERLKKALEENS
jgi:anti-sigma factor RsiW